MNIETSFRNGYRVIRVRESLGAQSDLRDLTDEVERAIGEGLERVALAFTEDSYLDSRAIGNLAKCVEMVEAVGGALAVVQPNPDIADFLRVVGFVDHIRLCASEQELQ